MDAQNSTDLTLGDLRCTTDKLVLLQDGRPIAHAPLAEIRSLDLRYGKTVPHPLLQLIIGLAFAALGAAPLLHLLTWSLNGGTYFMWELGIAVFMPLGAWVCWESARSGHFLEIWTLHGRQKFPFSRGTAHQQMQEFTSQLQSRVRAFSCK